MSKQTGQDNRDRVRMMVSDNGGTWDLSPNDKDALRHVLLLVDALTDEVAAYRGTTSPQVLQEIDRIMDVANEVRQTKGTK